MANGGFISKTLRTHCALAAARVDARHFPNIALGVDRKSRAVQSPFAGYAPGVTIDAHPLRAVLAGDVGARGMADSTGAIYVAMPAAEGWQEYVGVAATSKTAAALFRLLPSSAAPMVADIPTRFSYWPTPGNEAHWRPHIFSWPNSAIVRGTWQYHTPREALTETREDFYAGPFTALDSTALRTVLAGAMVHERIEATSPLALAFDAAPPMRHLALPAALIAFSAALCFCPWPIKISLPLIVLAMLRFSGRRMESAMVFVDLQLRARGKMFASDVVKTLSVNSPKYTADFQRALQVMVWRNAIDATPAQGLVAMPGTDGAMIEDLVSQEWIVQNPPRDGVRRVQRELTITERLELLLPGFAGT